MAARRKATTDKPSVEAQYLLLVDLEYNDKQVPAGETVTDIPRESLGWLIDSNYIKKVD